MEKAFYILLFIFSINIGFDSWADAALEKATKVAMVGIKASTELLTAGMEKTAIILANAGPDLGLNSVKVISGSLETTGQAIEQAAKHAGVDAVNELAKISEPWLSYAWAGLIAVSVAAAGCLGYKIYALWQAESVRQEIAASPQNVEQQLKSKEVCIKLNARENLKECMMKNRKLKRDSSGRPEVCEELALALAMAGGEIELEKMTAAYNQFK